MRLQLSVCRAVTSLVAETVCIRRSQSTRITSILLQAAELGLEEVAIIQNTTRLFMTDSQELDAGIGRAC